MARYEVTGPDGKYELTAPDNMSEADVLAYAQQHFAKAQAKPAAMPLNDLVTRDRRDRAQAAQAQPEASPKKGLFGSAWDMFGGIRQGLTGDLPLSVLGLGARGVDALGLNDEIGLPKGAFNALKDMTSDMPKGAAFNTGRFAGNVAATAPLTSLKTGLTPANALLRTGVRAGEGAGQGAAAMLATSAEKDMPLGQQVGLGATFGGIGGAVLPPVVNAVGSAARVPINYFRDRMLPRLGELPEGVSVPTARKAVRYVSDLARAAGRTPEEIAAFPPAVRGKPVLAAEAIGVPAETGLGALGRRSGRTGEVLEGTLSERAAGAPSRFLSDFEAATGIPPSAVQGNLEVLLEAGQKRAAPLYKEAFAGNQSVANSEIDAILETPAGKQAMKDAAEWMRNARSRVAIPDAELADQAREAGQAIPKGGVASGLKLEFLDYVKRAMDGRITAFARKGELNTAEAQGLMSARDDLVRALDASDATAAAGPNSLRPEGGAYKRARGAAGEYLSMKKAFDDGRQKFMGTDVTERDFSKYFSGLNDANKDAVRSSIAQSIFNDAQNGRLKASRLLVPRVRAKLETAFGPERAQQFIDGVMAEQRMAISGAQMRPNVNSTTAKIGAAIDEQDALGGLNFEGAEGVGNFITDLATAGPKRAVGNLVGGKLRGAADWLRTPGMSIPVRDEAGRLLMLPPQDLARIMNLPRLRPPTPVQAKPGTLGGYSIADLARRYETQ